MATVGFKGLISLITLKSYRRPVTGSQYAKS